MDNKKEKLFSLLSQKLSLSFKIINYELSEIIKDSLINLLKNYSEIENILELNEIEFIKILYFNRIIIHNILYHEDKTILIKYDKNNKLSHYFYLSLLINENANIINYHYSIDYIKEIYNRKINKVEKYKLIIISKLIIELIENFRGTDEFYKNESQNKIELKKIENDSIEIIKNNKNIFRQIDLDMNENSIKLKKIDEIYILIINALIKKRKFEDYEYINNIISQLDLENIKITKLMFDELFKILNSNEDYINDYTIINEEDLVNENKINFYYILLKYILKNSIYIYHIPFLFKTKKIIILIIKSGLKKLSKNKIYNNLKIKIDYIIKAILDTEYFYIKYLNKLNKETINQSKISKQNSSKQTKEDFSILNTKLLINSKENNNNEENNFQEEEQKNSNNEKNIKQINESFNNFFNINHEQKADYRKEQNKIENKSFLKSLNNFNNFGDIKSDIEFILKESTYTIHINKKENKSIRSEVSISEDINNNDYYQNLIKIIDNFKNKDLIFNEYKILYENIIKLINFIKYIEERIKKELINTFELKIKLKIKEIKEKNVGIIKYINCEYIVDIIEINIYVKNNIYLDENILNNSNRIYENFEKLITKLKGIITSISSISQKSQHNSSSQDTFNQIINIMRKASVYNIIEFIKIIEKYKEPAEYIKEIKNNFYIIGNINNIFFYDYTNYNCIKKIELNHRNISLKENKKGDFNLIVISNKDIKIIDLKKNFNINSIDIGYSNINIFILIKNNSIICCERGVFLISNLFSINGNIENIKILNESVYGAIKINNNIIAFTSNGIMSNGIDKISFYNINRKSITKKIKGYSFNISKNNLAIIPREENESNNKILLCACKKYSKEQKNGILLIKIQIYSNEIVISNNFYDTENFEVYCFCPILIIYTLNNDILNLKKNEIIDTEYFLVGGFDLNKKKGLIKLYKVVYNKNFDKTKIEFIQDIKIEKNVKEGSEYFDEFKGPITCMTQSTYTGNIIISCLDGTVYLFSPPNINGLK